jgi:hypothetical protein
MDKLAPNCPVAKVTGHVCSSVASAQTEYLNHIKRRNMSAHHETDKKPSCGCEHGHDESSLPRELLVAASGILLGAGLAVGWMKMGLDWHTTVEFALATLSGRGVGTAPADSFSLVFMGIGSFGVHFVLHGDVQRHPRISGILMESRHSVADGDEPTKRRLHPGIPVASLVRQVLIHTSHVCQTGTTDQDHLACWVYQK